MSDNQSPESFIASLPTATPNPDVIAGLAALPETSLLSAAERLRLDKLAVAGEVPVAPFAIQSEQITTFSDGSVLKWLPRPGSATQCILVEATGIQIAIVKDVNFAEFLCNAANIFVIATAKNNNTDNPLQILTTPILLPSAAPSSPSPTNPSAN